ncbi:MAG: hypothetical protein OXT67_10515, partial [Zetaproteobacteria bacterium]|nr:hypothetical protein [Zetaproteobacteria bacterium]
AGLLCRSSVCMARDWVFQPQVQSGITLGTVSLPNPNGETSVTESLGGVLVGGGINTELGRTLGAGVQYVMMIDLNNDQISRRALASRFSFNLWGGSKRILQSSKYARVYSGYQYQVAMLGEISLSEYEAATKDLSNQISGGVFETNLGLMLRRGSYGLEMLATVFSVAASNDRLKTSMYSLNLFYQI